MAQLTIWQVCLAKGISFFICENGAPGRKKKNKKKEDYKALTVTQCQSEKEQSSLQDSNILLYNDNWIQSWQGTSVSWPGNRPISQTRPAQNDHTFSFTIRIKKNTIDTLALKPHCWINMDLMTYKNTHTAHVFQWSSNQNKDQIFTKFSIKTKLIAVTVRLWGVLSPFGTLSHTKKTTTK